MASIRLNLFESFPLLNRAAVGNLLGVGSLHIQGVEIPGSISFNNLAMIMSASGTTAKTFSVSFGLYSLTGSTLSLANSASFSSNPGANALSWITFVTSATQDITPGNWYFGVILSTAGQSNLSLVNNDVAAFSGGGYGGGFVRGYLSVSTNALPVSIATSDMSKEGNNESSFSVRHPYIIISA